MNKVLEAILLAKQKLVKDMWGLDLSWTSDVTGLHLWLQTTTGNYITESKISSVELVNAKQLDAAISDQMNYMIKALEQKKKDSQEYWANIAQTSSSYWFGWGDSAASTTTGGGGATAAVDFAAMAKQHEEYVAKAKAEQEARMPQSLELMYELGWDKVIQQDEEAKAYNAKIKANSDNQLQKQFQKQAAAGMKAVGNMAAQITKNELFYGSNYYKPQYLVSPSTAKMYGGMLGGAGAEPVKEVKMMAKINLETGEIKPDFKE